MTECPYCAKEIQDAVIKRRWCGEVFGSGQINWHRLRILVPVFLLVAICCVTYLITESKAQSESGEEIPRTERWRRIDSSETRMSGATTKVTVVDNVVLVPVTIEHKGSEMHVLMLLDTGSSRTVVSADTAGRLNIDLTKARKMWMQVADGALVEARQIQLNAITLGPHTKKNADILVIKHAGPPVRYDGLLGMDLLRGLKYNIDFQRQTITWE